MGKAVRDRSRLRSKAPSVPRGTDVPSASDKKRLRRVSELLRHLAHPARLKHNVLAAPYFAKESAGRGEAETLAVRQIKHVIAEALETLTPRQRTIIERCDLGGELHSVAIRSLAISEGHFYRERRRSLEVIARHLSAPTTLGSDSRYNIVPDAFSITCAHAFALEQVGRVDQAIDVLKAMTSSIDDAAQKVTGYCRLTELCAARGLPEDALLYAQLAAEFANQTDGSTGNLQAEAAIARAMAIRHGGDEGEAEQIVTRTMVPMRALLHESNRPETQHAFGVGAILLAEQAIERGRSATADAWLSEAITELEHNHGAHSALRLQLLRWRAFAQMLIPRNLTEATSELERLLAVALESGLMVEASTTATTLAAAYRLLQQPRKGIEILLTTLDLIRDSLSGEDRGGALTELAEAYVASGEPERALQLIAEIRSSRDTGSLIHALSFLLEANIYFLRGESLGVLRASHSAIEHLTVLGRVRLVGQALRMQALALEAIGDHANALTSIDVAIQHLEACGTPWIALKAQIDSARLRGDQIRFAMLKRQQAELTAVSHGLVRAH